VNVLPRRRCIVKRFVGDGDSSALRSTHARELSRGRKPHRLGWEWPSALPGAIAEELFHHTGREFWLFLDSPVLGNPAFKYPPAPTTTSRSSSILHSIAIMCASCNEAATNGHANGSATNATNGANNHEGYTSIKSTHNPHPSHKSPYLPVGDFLSNVSRFKIIGTSPRSGERDRRCAASAIYSRIRTRNSTQSNDDADFTRTESTLREGEQFANAYFDLEAKIKIAKALDEFGVDCMALLRGTCLAECKN
jgi:hypothetical protein